MILLSFDTEEFDMPLEYGKQISFDEQMSISIKGTNSILEILDKHQIKATFFCTATFALHAKEITKKIASNGHEIASHGYHHSQFENAHLLESKLILEKLTQTEVIGFRMARMQPVDNDAIKQAGYLYNSSINPTYLPGRYNHFRKPRTFFKEQELIQIPASVSPIIRFPLFWLSFHNLPLKLYTWISKLTHNKDSYLNIYFHPWEFTDLHKTHLGMPPYVKRNSGAKMIERMDKFITHFKNQNYTFGTFKDFLESQNLTPITLSK